MLFRSSADTLGTFIQIAKNDLKRLDIQDKLVSSFQQNSNVFITGTDTDTFLAAITQKGYNVKMFKGPNYRISPIRKFAEYA